MKFICDDCGEATTATKIEMQAGVLTLTCAACGHANAVSTEDAPVEGGGTSETSESLPSDAAAEPDISETAAKAAPAAPGTDTPIASTESPGAAPTESDPLPRVKCPKCFHRQARLTNCARCGLDLGRLDELDIDFELPPPGKESAFEEANSLWAEIEAKPNSRERHERFLAHTTNAQILDYAVRRYRSRLSDGARESMVVAFSEKAAERMHAIAMTVMQADPWADNLGRQVLRFRRVLFVVAAILMIAGIVLAIVMFQKRGAVTPIPF